MPKPGKVEQTPSKMSSKSKSDQNVKVLKGSRSGTEDEPPLEYPIPMFITNVIPSIWVYNTESEPKKNEGPGKISARVRRNMERVEMLARPNARRLRSLWDEKCSILSPARRDKIKSALEEDYFLSPEQTEQYFQALAESSKRWSGPGGMVNRKEFTDKSKELRQRQKWLVNFSAQVAYCLCDYIAKGQKEMLVSNRLRSIADVVLERVADILGEPKPSRTHPGRLARFMVAISDRIAVWIENAVYRADALEPDDASYTDEHIRLDAEKPLIC